jgi:hypothetical protein
LCIMQELGTFEIQNYPQVGSLSPFAAARVPWIAPLNSRLDPKIASFLNVT